MRIEDQWPVERRVLVRNHADGTVEYPGVGSREAYERIVAAVPDEGMRPRPHAIKRGDEAVRSVADDEHQQGDDRQDDEHGHEHGSDRTPPWEKPIMMKVGTRWWGQWRVAVDGPGGYEIRWQYELVEHYRIETVAWESRPLCQCYVCRLQRGEA